MNIILFGIHRLKFKAGSNFLLGEKNIYNRRRYIKFTIGKRTVREGGVEGKKYLIVCIGGRGGTNR